MQMNRLTPVLFVERIEPCLELWEKRLGFKRIVEVPEGGRLGFVILAQEDVQLMYQSWESVAKDVPAVAPEMQASRQFIYIDVDDLAAVERALSGVSYLIPRRTTFYGATEVLIRDPAGHVLVFAQQG